MNDTDVRKSRAILLAVDMPYQIIVFCDRFWVDESFEFRQLHRVSVGTTVWIYT